MALKKSWRSMQANLAPSYRRKMGSRDPCLVTQGHAISCRKADQLQHHQTPSPLPLPQASPSPAHTFCSCSNWSLFSFFGCTYSQFLQHKFPRPVRESKLWQWQSLILNRQATRELLLVYFFYSLGTVTGIVSFLGLVILKIIFWLITGQPQHLSKSKSPVLITCPFPEHGFKKPPGHWTQSGP